MKVIIADASISLVPHDWLKDKKISNYFKKTGRLPIRDASIHQHLLKGIPKKQRFDRPDILHFGLLTALGYARIIKSLEIYFSCKSGLYKIEKTTRLPRSQTRFYGILETLLNQKYNGKLIQKIDDNFLSQKKINFSSKGTTLDNDIIRKNNVFIFGGFSTGDFLTSWGKNKVIMSLSSEKLELWTAVSLFLNKYLKLFS